jgi:dienelactone hydrolase
MTKNPNVLSMLRVVLLACVGTGSVSAADVLTEQLSRPDRAVALSITWVKPSDADPAVTHFDDPNLVIVPKQTSARAPLVVFLPGSNGRPANVRLLLSTIAQQGYRAIGLEYNYEPSVVQTCSHHVDPDCSSLFRRQRIYGDADGSPINNPAEESITRRLTKLLQHLEQLQPDSQWGRYLNGDRPDWSQIVISGLSQGAGMAAYIAQRESVARVVLFSSPWDFYGKPRKLAPWLAGPSVTPPERWFAEFHRREATAPLIEKAYDTLRIPRDHVLVFDLDLADGSHGQNPFHGSTVKLPGYESQWRWLYGSALTTEQSTSCVYAEAGATKNQCK